MKDIEVLQRAKLYIDKLAMGINPINDQQIPENEVVNNVRVVRCLYYVSDVLSRVINGEGYSKTRKRKKSPFSITYEKLQKFEYSNDPVPLTTIVRKINSLVDSDSVKKLSYKTVLGWLKDAGLVQDAQGMYGNAKNCPTQRGEEIGITIEHRIGSRGEYFVLCYNRTAQEVIVNHLISMDN